MMTYKRHYVWYNYLQGKWLVQRGYEVVYTANTLSSAKRWITLHSMSY